MSKLFCIGFQKTGTASMRRAFKILGYRVCGMRYDLLPAVKERDMGPVFALVDQYDAFRDNPWPLLFRELDAAYPGSKFILTTRDEDRWIRSMVNHLGVLPDPMQQFIYGYGAPGGYEEIFLARYRRHNEEVRGYFAQRPGDLLIVDWEKGDGWPQLCAFLKREIPAQEFPHLNSRTYEGFTSRLKFAAAKLIRAARGWKPGKRAGT